MRTSLSRTFTVAAVGVATLALGATGAAADDVHTVEAGDTLTDIANGTESVDDWRELAELNDDIIDDPDLIQIGLELALHGDAEGTTPEAPSSSDEAADESAAEPEATETDQTSSGDPAAAAQNVSLETWEALAQCESSGDWSINTSNGFYGGLQFTQQSWEWVGGTGQPHHASKAEQIERAEILLERQGWDAWPSCSSQLGLR